MPDDSLTGAALAEASEKDLREYGAVSRWSVASLILGVVSFVALYAPLLLIVPVLGAFAAWRALIGIRESDMALVGRKAAPAGLALSTMFATAVPAQYAAARWWLLQEADAFGRQWFDYVKHDEPLKANQLCVPPTQRVPLENREQLLEYYQIKEGARDEIKFFLNDDLIKVLLRLGEKAQVRLYANEDFTQRRAVGVTNVYAVSYLDGTNKKTFFVRLVLEQSSVGDEWQIVNYGGGIRPESPP